MIELAAAATSALTVALLLHARGRRRPATPFRSASSSWMSGSGLDVTPIQFWGASLGAGMGAFLVVLAVTSLPWVSLMPAVVVATLPRAHFGRQRSKRILAVQASWPDGLRDILSSIRGGASLPTAVEEMARLGPAPLREAFSGFSAFSRSLGFIPALELIRADLADPTSDRVIEVLILAHEKGGTVVTQILSDLAEATTRDIWAMEQVATEALEQKINARVVFVLPWLVLIVITARSGAFRSFYQTPAGVMVAMIGGVMSLIGIVIASRLGRHPDEPRVLVKETSR